MTLHHCRDHARHDQIAKLLRSDRFDVSLSGLDQDTGTISRQIALTSVIIVTGGPCLRRHGRNVHETEWRLRTG